MTTCAEAKLEEIRIAGKTLYVPSVEVCGRTVVERVNGLERHKSRTKR